MVLFFQEQRTLHLTYAQKSNIGKNLLAQTFYCIMTLDLLHVHVGCEITPDVNVNKEKFNIKIKLKESDDIEICCSCVSLNVS